MRSSRILSALSLAALLCGLSANFAVAQVTESSSSSSSSTSTEGTVKGYAFKYKQKFDTYSEQIEMGVSKGWLTAAQAQTFKTRLADLRSVEAAASKNGYPDAEIASLDKLTTKFNQDLSSASSKSSATAGSASAANASTSPKTKTSTKTTTKKTK